MLYSKEPTDVPSAQFVWQVRAAVQVLGKTITAIKLANAPAEIWRQLFVDATTRGQTPFQTVIIGLMDNGVLDPVVVSSCIFLEDESAETSVENMIAKVYFILICIYNYLPLKMQSHIIPFYPDWISQT